MTATAGTSRADQLLPDTGHGRLLVVAILAIALLLRLGVVLETRQEYVPATDALHFDHIATSLAGGRGYGHAIVPPAKGPSAFRAPLYPATLGAVYALVGDHAWTWGRAANAGIGTVAVALIGLVGTLLWSRRVGTIAMALAAVHPALILVGSSLQLEPLLVALSLGTLAATLQHRRSPRGLRWPILAGILLGLTFLTRELGFLLVPPIAWLLWTAGPPGTRRFDRQAVTAPAVTVIIALAVLAPWTIRNAVQLDAFVPVTTSAGFGLAGTYNDTSRLSESHPGRWVPPYNVPNLARILSRMRNPTEVKVDRAMRDASIEIVRDHPTYPATVAFWNTVRLFDLDGGAYARYTAPFTSYSLRLTRLSVFASYAVLVLAVVGAFTRLARRPPMAVWAIPVLFYAFMVVFLPASIRYRASLEPFFVLLASLTIVTAFERLRVLAVSQRPPPSGA